ncbi:MAG: HD domain-containing protein, partial [Clostridia bacterium]|nr:HD domain-containing protein [Clostridia bacterium]
KDETYRNLLTDDVIDRMENAAPLHDVGKIIVSDTILLKPGKLTEEEFEKMKIHTSAGEELIAKLFRNMNDTEFLQTAKDIAVYHHERWDGKGYPKGLSQDAIPLCARIMAIADVYDALISVRVYKPAIDPEKALEIIMSESGTHFDPDIIRVINDIKDELADIANISGTDENSHNKT